MLVTVVRLYVGDQDIVTSYSHQHHRLSRFEINPQHELFHICCYRRR